MPPYINPLGFIDRRTQRGVRFLLTDPDDARILKSGTPVTITQPSSERLALAKIRGEIVAVGYVTATFTIVETVLDPEWPESEETVRKKTPVYLARKESFEPDPSRMLTPEQAERIWKLSSEYNNILRNERSDDDKPTNSPRGWPPTQVNGRGPFPQQLDE